MRTLFREVASLAIYNPKLKKILVQDRTSISKYGEEVTFFGGGLDNGETPIQAARRESKEELGNVFSSYEYLWKFVHDMDGKDYVRHLFIIVTDQENFTDNEWDGWVRLSIEEAKTKKFITDMVPEFEAIEKRIQREK